MNVFCAGQPSGVASSANPETDGLPIPECLRCGPWVMKVMPSFSSTLNQVPTVLLMLLRDGCRVFTSTAWVPFRSSPSVQS